MKVQTNWDARAAINFMCGGTGAGLMIATELVRPPSAELAVALALAFVATGLAAVWHELGKPRRALHVFFNPMTSWMARESFAAALLFLLGAGAIFTTALLPFAAAVAAAFLYCQVRMLQGAKGIPAWRARATVPLMLSTALAEGAGMALLFTNSLPALGLFAFAVAVRILAWRRHAASAPSPALESAAFALLEIGTVVPLALSVAGVFFAPAGWLAGLLVVATGWRLKHALITRASFKQGFTLPRLPVRGTQ